MWGSSEQNGHKTAEAIVLQYTLVTLGSFLVLETCCSVLGGKKDQEKSRASKAPARVRSAGQAGKAGLDCSGLTCRGFRDTEDLNKRVGRRTVYLVCRNRAV